MKNPITVINEPKLSNDNPVMAWLDVHPLAHLEPNPIHNLPKAIINISVQKLHIKLDTGNILSIQIDLESKYN